MTSDASVEQAALFEQGNVTVTKTVLAHGETLPLASGAGVATSLVVARGRGYLAVAKIEIELGPGRVLDLSMYTRRNYEYAVTATSADGLELIRTDVMYGVS
jgi:hypothetical protein